MKKTVVVLLCLLGGLVSLNAQHDSRADILSDIERAGGVHYLYPTDQPRPTAAPKGYKPFYVSHLGRHGARYALGNTVYTDLWNIWSRAHEKAWLTPEGEAFYQAYAALYPAIRQREGNLTAKGQEQLRYIARSLYRNYPRLFKGATHASAVSTGSHRVIVSMYSLLSELDRLDKDFTFDADYGYPYQGYLLPEIIDRPTPLPDSVVRKEQDFYRRMVPQQQMLSRWFTRPDSVVANPQRFLGDLHTVVSTLDNLDTEPAPELYAVFTPEERYGLWASNNYNGYVWMGPCPDVENVRPAAMQALLQDIISKAQEDIASGQVQLRLRFSHDSALLPLLSLMDVNGMGTRTSDPERVGDSWRTFDVPMACNLQLVFFRRGRTSSDILVQVLLNGREATLPLPMAAPGSFYRWTDFVLRYSRP